MTPSGGALMTPGISSRDQFRVRDLSHDDAFPRRASLCSYGARDRVLEQALEIGRSVTIL